LNWSDIDLQKRTLTTHRAKTGIVRVAVLWQRTMEALAKLPKDTDAIFLTSGTRMRHNYQTFYKNFKAVRKAAKVNVQVSDIRDGSYTAAVEAGIELHICKLLAGHASGIDDHYVKRRPMAVSAACSAIEAAYFG
jgi:integrase